MTRRRQPRRDEIQAAARDPRLQRALFTNPDDPSWRMMCRTVDPETFFPLPTEPTIDAQRLCWRCPVAGECLASALSAGDVDGVWGATTPRERVPMLAVWRHRTGARR